MSFKEKHKKDRLSKIHYSMFMLQYDWNIEYSLSIHLFYGRFYLLALSYHIVTKRRTHLHNQQLKDAGLFKFVWRFVTIRHERASKIHVHGYPFYPTRNY